MIYENALNEYLNYLSINLKPTTRLNLIRIFKNHITPHFKEKKMNNITNGDYLNWVNYIKSKNNSNSFNENVYYAIKKFFDYLEKMYNIDNIPRKYGRFYNFSIDTKVNIISIWNITEFKRFINSVNEPIYHCFFDLLFYTGLRKGEAMALRFYDLNGNKLTVNKNITKDCFNGKRLELKPKTKKSERQILIDTILKNEILKLKKYYSTKYDNFNDNFYIFGGTNPLAPTTIERKKNKYCKIAGVKQIRIHDFRHSHASMLYSGNVNIKYIQERLGHADISTTLNTYVHLNKEYEKKVIRALLIQKLL